jgi:CobQ/CobB/MinD/ParA nucleotide binding domain
MKKQLNLILNGKGGVGKSFFAINLVQYLKDKAIPFVACDSDNENSTLKRFHPDAEFINLAQSRSLDDMFRALERADLVVVDCRAASTDVFLRYFVAIDIAAVLRALDARLTLLMPVNHEADSLDQVQRVVEAMANHARFTIIRNQVHAELFTLYDKSAVRVRLLKQLDAKEITMPRMEEWLVESLNRVNLDITAAAKHESFYLLDRQRLVTWQHRLYEQIETTCRLMTGKFRTCNVRFRI